jgi:uncharacterized protein YodC (DUF2158 family)
MEFKIGDVLALRSGGLVMTAEDIDEDGMIGCVWFDKGKLERNWFKAATLEKASKPSATIGSI